MNPTYVAVVYDSELGVFLAPMECFDGVHRWSRVKKASDLKRVKVHSAWSDAEAVIGVVEASDARYTAGVVSIHALEWFVGLSEEQQDRVFPAQLSERGAFETNTLPLLFGSMPEEERTP